MFTIHITYLLKGECWRIYIISGWERERESFAKKTDSQFVNFTETVKSRQGEHHGGENEMFMRFFRLRAISVSSSLVCTFAYSLMIIHVLDAVQTIFFLLFFFSITSCLASWQ